MKTREGIISAMCLTWRHDYGLLPEDQRENLFKQMAQIFDNDIAPNMQFKKERKPKRTKDEKQFMKDLGYSRIGADAFKRGR